MFNNVIELNKWSKKMKNLQRHFESEPMTEGEVIQALKDNFEDFNELMWILRREYDYSNDDLLALQDGIQNEN